MENVVVVEGQLFGQLQAFLAEANRLGGVCEQEKHPDGHWGPVKLVMRLRSPLGRQPRLPAMPLRATSSARPRERRGSSRAGATRAGPDEPRKPRPNGRRCENPECRLPLEGRPNKRYCDVNCKQLAFNYRHGAKPLPAKADPQPAPPVTDARLRSRIRVAAELRHRLWRSLPSANGDSPEISADIARLTDLLDGPSRYYEVELHDWRTKRTIRIRDRRPGGLWADVRQAEAVQG
jgi:hypothetical protein